MSTLDSDGEQLSDREFGSVGELTSRDALEDSVDGAEVETLSQVYGERQTITSAGMRPVNGEDDEDVLVAQPPKERDGNDYTVAISGTTALDILDQVRDIPCQIHAHSTYLTKHDAITTTHIYMLQQCSVMSELQLDTYKRFPYLQELSSLQSVCQHGGKSMVTSDHKIHVS